MWEMLGELLDRPFLLDNETLAAYVCTVKTACDLMEVETGKSDEVYALTETELRSVGCPTWAERVSEARREAPFTNASKQTSNQASKVQASNEASKSARNEVVNQVSNQPHKQTCEQSSK